MSLPGTALQYGAVTLDLIGTGDVVRQPVYDVMNNYRYTLWTLPVIGYFNPGANAYKLPGNFGDPFANNNAGQSPALTDDAVRRYLMEPRRHLTYSVGPDIVLETPVQNPGQVQFNVASGTVFQCDAANGPIPRYCRVTRVAGVKTFLVSYVVEAAVVEDELFTNTPSVMLSHTWGVTSSLDVDFYETRFIRGTAVFRVDLLLGRNSVPDDFRAYLSHPIENGYKRDDVQVELLEDGTGVRYAVVDRRKALSVTADASVSRIEATMAAGVMKPSAFTVLVGGVVPLIGASGHLQVVQAVGNMVASALPRATIEIAARIWGRPYAQKSVLAGVAMQIIKLKLLDAFGQFPGGAARGFMAGATVSVLYDQAGRYVEAQAVVLSPTLNAGDLDVTPTLSIPNPVGYMPATDDIVGVLEGGKAGNNLPDDSGLRQSFDGTGGGLTSLVAAVLRQPYAAPPKAAALPADAGQPNGFRKRRELTPP